MKANEMDNKESIQKVAPLKKNWVKPEVEVISTDEIQGGSVRFYTEGQRSATFNRAGSS